MKAIKIGKSDLTKDLSEKICFLYFVASFAQGHPGLVNFITNDGNEYWFDYLYGDITIDDAVAFFPALAESQPDGWKCETLGLVGHVVFISEIVYEAFMNEIKDRRPVGLFKTLPSNWMDTALKVVDDMFGRFTKGE